MGSKSSVEHALTRLINMSSEKGFVLFDDIYNVSDAWNLSIGEVDYLSSAIITRGILVYDEVPISEKKITAEDDFEDYAQHDYDRIYNRVVELDSGLGLFIKTVRQVIPPQQGEMRRLKYQVQEGNTYARERVIQMHLRLAIRLALQRAEVYGTEIADTIQDACMGLITAVDRYDPDSSGSFSGYASLWILQTMSRLQGTQRPLVYYPVHIKEHYFTMYPILKDLMVLDPETIWVDEKVRDIIKRKIGCDARHAEEIVRQSMPLESIEDFCEEIDECEDGRRQAIWLEPQRSVANNDLCEESDRVALEKVIDELLGELSPREQEVIRARMGFFDGREQTLEEVGNRMGVTRERIRQIESKALRKLKQPKRIIRVIDFY